MTVEQDGEMKLAAARQSACGFARQEIPARTNFKDVVREVVFIRVAYYVGWLAFAIASSSIFVVTDLGRSMG